METAIGNGCVMIGSCERDGRVGLLLEQTCEPHDINSPAAETRAQPGKPFIPGENDGVIWIDGLAGARVLQDRINMIILHLEGYGVGL